MHVHGIIKKDGYLQLYFADSALLVEVHACLKHLLGEGAVKHGQSAAVVNFAVSKLHAIDRSAWVPTKEGLFTRTSPPQALEVT